MKDALAWCYRRVKDFWCEPIAPQPLAMMRIVMGIVVLAGVLINIAPYLFDFWSPEGFIPAETAARYAEFNDRISLFQLADSNTAICRRLRRWFAHRLQRRRRSVRNRRLQRNNRCL